MVTIFGKSWDLHVKVALGVSLKENLDLIRNSVAFLKSHGREVIYDAEHFFDGYKADSGYTLGNAQSCGRGRGGFAGAMRHERRHDDRRHPGAFSSCGLGTA